MHLKTSAALGNTIKLHYRWWIFNVHPLPSELNSWNINASVSVDISWHTNKKRWGRDGTQWFALFSKRCGLGEAGLCCTLPSGKTKRFPLLWCGRHSSTAWGRGMTYLWNWSWKRSRCPCKVSAGRPEIHKNRTQFLFFIIGKCFGTHE